MQHLIKLLVCISFLLSSVAVYAAPVGNIATPAMLKSAYISKDEENSQMGVIVAGEFDFTKDRKIKDATEDTEYNFYGGKSGVVFANKAFVYGLIGTADFQEKFDDEGSSVKIESDADLAWGLGATIIFFEKQLDGLDNSTLRFGIDGKFRYSEIDVDKVIIDSVSYDIPHANVTEMQLDYSDWHVAGAVSLQWDRFVPYIGVKYSDFDATVRATVLGTRYEDDSSEPKNNVGIFVGADVLLLDSVSINVEGRFIDEEALSLGCAVRF